MLFELSAAMKAAYASSAVTGVFERSVIFPRATSSVNMKFRQVQRLACSRTSAMSALLNCSMKRPLSGTQRSVGRNVCGCWGCCAAGRCGWAAGACAPGAGGAAGRGAAVAGGRGAGRTGRGPAVSPPSGGRIGTCASARAGRRRTSVASRLSMGGFRPCVTGR